MRRPLLVLAFVVLPWPALAQSSQWSARGFGLPGRELSARAMATGGGFALFDEISSRNPASISSLQGFTASFTGLRDQSALAYVDERRMSSGPLLYLRARRNF